jgi:hypothetical protein
MLSISATTDSVGDIYLMAGDTMVLFAKLTANTLVPIKMQAWTSGFTNLGAVGAGMHANSMFHIA